MRKSPGFLLVLLIVLVSYQIDITQGIPCFYGGSLQEDTWSRLLRTGVMMFESSADFQHNPWEPELVHRLADSGVKINFRLFWWWQFYNGEVAWNTSVVDLYYNETLMGLLEGFVDGQLDQLDPEKIWAVTLSEEEPGYSLRYFWTHVSLERYNNTFHEETGYWLRGRYNLNRTEEKVLNQWLSEKTVHVFNHLYDYVKSKWPHVFVFQFIALSPGAPPVWGGGLDLTGLKADALKADLYYYDVYDNPFWLYEYVRHAKTAFPDEELHFWLWGEESWEEGGLAGGFEHIRRNAWVAYLAGVDAVGWFNWHYEHGVMWEREDILGKQLIEYTSRLSRELGKLPPFKPRPEVLVINDTPMCFQLGVGCDLGLLHEWDSIDQFTIAEGGFDLSGYSLIIANEAEYLDSVVDKLNQYVRSGGNLLLLGGFGRGQKNLYENATRETLFLMEEGVTQKELWGETLLKIAKPNPLDLELEYRNEAGGDCILALELSTLSENHQVIGSYYEAGGGGSPIPLDSSPLVLYHNSSSSEEGWILYWGGQKTRTLDEGNWDVVEAFIGELNHTRLVYREVSRAFAGGFLGLRGCVTKDGEENVLITQSEVEGGVLAGIMNNYPHGVDLDYVLDLGRFGLPPGEYWVHSLDGNVSLGRHASEGSVLEVPIHVGAMETRLLLISQEEPAPSYSVDTSPEVPSPEEVVDLWNPMLVVLSDYGEVTGGGVYKPGERASFGVSSGTVPGGDGVRYVFEGWSSQDEEGYTGGDNPAVVVMEGDVTEVAVWRTQYLLAIETEKGGSVTPGSGWHDAGSKVIVAAEPAGGFTFVSWLGDGDGSYSGPEASHVVVMDGPVRQTAVFLDVEPPVADAGPDRRVAVGEEVAFNALFSKDNAGIVWYDWDFGDGATEAGLAVDHSYGSPGAYTVTLTVEDAASHVDTDTAIITVEEKVEPGGLGTGFPTWLLFIVVVAFILGLIPYLLVKATSGER